jgi:hypothetical protein
MRIHRVVLVALLIGIGPVVAGCADGFDMDKLDVFNLNKKKPLPGERHALFPEGVPGVQQGVPPEYLKGNVALQTGAAVPIEPLKPEEVQPAQTEEKAAEEKPKPKPKKRVAAKPKPTRVNVSQKPSQQPAQQQPQQAGSPWPDQQQPAPAPWPSAPPPGTFSKQ